MSIIMPIIVQRIRITVTPVGGAWGRGAVQFTAAIDGQKLIINTFVCTSIRNVCLGLMV